MGLKDLTTKQIIIISIAISTVLAVSLGVGLALGLEEVVEVTEKPEKSTTTSDPTIITNGPTETPDGAPWLNYRLPEYIIPYRYDLTLRPDLTTNIYAGTNEITFGVTADTQYVLVHAHATLDISAVYLQWNNSGDLTEWPISREFRYAPYEFYVIEAENKLPKGEQFVMSMSFRNFLNESTVGIFKSIYNDPDGSEKFMMVSDMQPTNARRGYPCFDEPAMKIRYKTTIVHDSAYIALSNMPVETTKEIQAGLNETVFELSVPMSTYIGCFIVCEFDHVEAFSNRGVSLRIYATKSQVQNGQVDFALNVTKILLDRYEELFDMEYPLTKYDQIAIPNLVNFGAMENWGIVTFREQFLLWDRNESSTADRQRVAAVVAHEMVHMWFGNIVTLSWWENLWLNEGFASYFEYQGLEYVEPVWQSEGFHVIDDSQRALAFDALAGSHPLKVNVSTPAQISEVFDTLSYQKGSSILKMMNNILGNETFIGGLRRYLKDMKFSNANELDLWRNVQSYVDDNGGGFNVAELMDPWVQQRGFPIVYVEMAGQQVKATQEIMLADTSMDVASLPSSLYDYRWNVVLEYYSQDNSAVQKMTFPRNGSDYEFEGENLGDWIKLNYYERGYYRVNYETSLWESLVTQLTNDITALHEYDRCNLLDDAFNLAPIGKINYTTALDMTKYLDKEESYFVWYAFSAGSSYISTMLSSTIYYSNFKTYYLTKVKPIADKLGWDASEGTHEEKRNRPIVLGLALGYGDEDAARNASALFYDWRNGNSISTDIRSLVYRYGILNGNELDWDYMLDKYKVENVAGEKDNLLRGLAATEDVALIDRLLEYSKDTVVIKDQDFFSCITYISYTVNGNRMAWSWVRLNWDYLVERFTLESRGLGRLIPSIVENYNTELKKWEVENFFEAEPEAGAGEDARANALLQIDLNIAWLRDNQEPIGQWLEDQVSALS